MVGSGIDAHDLSDAGMEAAAMERYVEQRLLLRPWIASFHYIL